MWVLLSKVEVDEHELAGVWFKWMKCLENSCICHQREVCRFTGRSSYDILIKHYKDKIDKKNFFIKIIHTVYKD